MADNRATDKTDAGASRAAKTSEYKADRADPKGAAEQLNTGPAATMDAAFGPTLWQSWQDHVVKHVQLPDEDNDGKVEPAEPVVPLLVYGDGPNDYVSTDIDAGQVIVRDGNDKSGKPWLHPLDAFYRFLAHAQGKKVEGEPEEEGDNPLVAAIKQQKRTNEMRAREREAAEAAQRDGETRTAK